MFYKHLLFFLEGDIVFDLVLLFANVFFYLIDSFAIDALYIVLF